MFTKHLAFGKIGCIPHPHPPFICQSKNHRSVLLSHKFIPSNIYIYCIVWFPLAHVTALLLIVTPVTAHGVHFPSGVCWAFSRTLNYSPFPVFFPRVILMPVSFSDSEDVALNQCSLIYIFFLLRFEHLNIFMRGSGLSLHFPIPRRLNWKLKWTLPDFRIKYSFFSPY